MICQAYEVARPDQMIVNSNILDYMALCKSFIIIIIIITNIPRRLVLVSAEAACSAVQVVEDRRDQEQPQVYTPQSLTIQPEELESFSKVAWLKTNQQGRESTLQPLRWSRECLSVVCSRNSL